MASHSDGRPDDLKLGHFDARRRKWLLTIWVSHKERRRLGIELKRKGLTFTDWFREQLAASEGERLLRGHEFVRMEIEEEAVVRAEVATAKEAEALLFAADRHRGTRPEDMHARQELRLQAEPWLEASGYWLSVLTRFRRTHDRLARDQARASATSAESARQTPPRRPSA